MNKTAKRLTSAAAASLAIGAIASYAFFVRPWHLRWGTTEEENGAPLPGDEVMPDGDIQVTHAITIEAPASIVWKYLVQIGQDRGGFYSYDYIENLFGLRIHNTGEVQSELQDLKEGDFVRSAHTGWLGGRFRDITGWFVVGLEPESSLVLRDEIEKGSWSFVLRRVDENLTRLIARVRGRRPQNIPMKFFSYTFFEPAHFIMERKMLLTLKDLSERAVAREEFPAERPAGLSVNQVGAA